MAKQVTSVRLDAETTETLARLEMLYAYQSAADTHADAIRRLDRGLAVASAAVAERFTPAEWCLMADVMNGTMLLPGFPPTLFVTREQQAEADAKVGSLVARLAALTGDEAAAVAYAVRWFWVHSDDPAVTLRSPWWSPEWRKDRGAKP